MALPLGVGDRGRVDMGDSRDRGASDFGDSSTAGGR